MEQNWNEFKALFTDILMNEKFSDSLLTTRFLKIKNKLRQSGKYNLFLHRTFGHSYVMSETAYHMLGGKESGWKSMHLNHLGCSHWFLKHKSGFILDLASEQFQSQPNYNSASSKGFMTKNPCEKTKKLMAKILSNVNFALKMAPPPEKVLDNQISDIIMSGTETAPKILEKLGNDLTDVSTEYSNRLHGRLYNSY